MADKKGILRNRFFCARTQANRQDEPRVNRVHRSGAGEYPGRDVADPGKEVRFG
ncbi:hypothetical protein SAMN05519105_1893 [Rhodobacter sp. 24-YEA-8]|nr:hypothetical protein SAMN05519105_1893 [Rhodobacter sp. 24-YEA-8]